MLSRRRKRLSAVTHPKDRGQRLAEAAKPWGRGDVVQVTPPKEDAPAGEWKNNPFGALKTWLTKEAHRGE
jgi:hypothetical protein